MKKKFLIFDLDGVLIDSINNMQLSWKMIQKTYNLNQEFEVFFKHLGKPFNQILTDIGIKLNQDRIKNSYKKWSIKYFNKIKIYPGVINNLNFLKKKKYKIGIVTSKDKVRTRKIINIFKLNIDLHVSPTKLLKGKPNPDTLLYAIKKMRLKKSECVYIGDTKIDYLAAKRAKIDFIFANYGYFNDELDCKNRINKFSEIKNIIDVT